MSNCVQSRISKRGCQGPIWAVAPQKRAILTRTLCFFVFYYFLCALVCGYLFSFLSCVLPVIDFLAVLLGRY